MRGAGKNALASCVQESYHEEVNAETEAARDKITVDSRPR